MNTKSDSAISAAGSEIAGMTGQGRATESGVNAKKLRAFQAKYEAMLNVVEFMAALECLHSGSTRRGRGKMDLDAMISEARKGLLESGNGGRSMPHARFNDSCHN